MSNSPIEKLLHDLQPLIEQYASALMVSQRYPEFPDVTKKARAQVIQQEIYIEDVIRTWVEKAGPRVIRSDDDDQPDS